MLEVGFIGPTKSLITNIIGSAVGMILSRVLARVVGG